MAGAAALRIDAVAAAAPAVRRVIAVVAGTVAMRREELPARVIEGLRHDLSFPNPDFVARKRMGRYVGATPERIECLTETPDGWVHVPRGAVARLRERIAEARLGLSFQDRRVTGEPLSATPAIDLRPYQKEAVAAARWSCPAGAARRSSASRRSATSVAPRSSSSTPATWSINGSRCSATASS
jgi:hypothetical protein